MNIQMADERSERIPVILDGTFFKICKNKNEKILAEIVVTNSDILYLAFILNAKITICNTIS